MHQTGNFCCTIGITKQNDEQRCTIFCSPFRVRARCYVALRERGRRRWHLDGALCIARASHRGGRSSTSCLSSLAACRTGRTSMPMQSSPLARREPIKTYCAVDRRSDFAPRKTCPGQRPSDFVLRTPYTSFSVWAMQTSSFAQQYTQLIYCNTGKPAPPSIYIPPRGGGQGGHFASTAA